MREPRQTENESFNDFYAKNNDIVNFRFNIGEKIKGS
jgi:hypothetical protein